jgi:hypothetical protein
MSALASFGWPSSIRTIFSIEDFMELILIGADSGKAMHNLFSKF